MCHLPRQVREWNTAGRAWSVVCHRRRNHSRRRADTAGQRRLRRCVTTRRHGIPISRCIAVHRTPLHHPVITPPSGVTMTRRCRLHPLTKGCTGARRIRVRETAGEPCVAWSTPLNHEAGFRVISAKTTHYRFYCLCGDFHIVRLRFEQGRHETGCTCRQEEPAPRGCALVPVSQGPAAGTGVCTEAARRWRTVGGTTSRAAVQPGTVVTRWCSPGLGAGSGKPVFRRSGRHGERHDSRSWHHRAGHAVERTCTAVPDVLSATGTTAGIWLPAAARSAATLSISGYTPGNLSSTALGTIQ